MSGDQHTLNGWPSAYSLTAIAFLLMTIALLCPLSAWSLRKRTVVAATDSTEAYTLLDEVVVRPGKVKYSKKNNPAVALMKQVRAMAASGDPAAEGNYSFDFHDKISLALNDVDPDSRFWKKMGLGHAYVDTAMGTGRTVMLVSVKEKVGKRLLRRSPYRDKRIVEGFRSDGIDKAFDQKNISVMLEDVLREVDIYGNDIVLMQNRFVSPLSSIADDFYRYFITDTLSFPDDTTRYVELSFSPRSPESFGFNGKLYVAAYDSLRFIKKVSMRVPRVINLNFVDNIFINQEFMLDSLGKRHKVLDDMGLEIQLMEGTPSFYGRRTSAARNFSYHPDPAVAEYYNRSGMQFLTDDASSRNSDFWRHRRIITLSAAESNVGSLLARLREKPFFYWSEKALHVIVTGYIGTTPGKGPSYFDLGPVNTFLSYNKVEGLRIRLGGMTTGNLSHHLFGRGYVAYGCHDRKWKYRVEGEYSFPRKELHAREFPIHSFRASHQYDIEMLGQRYLFTNADNIFLSPKRKQSLLAVYQRHTELKYTLELENHFSVEGGLRHQILYSTPWVEFVDGYGRMNTSFTRASLFIRLRYAPGEIFVQGRTSRAPVNMDAPVFQLTHEYGPKGFLGSAYSLNVSELSIRHRIWLSAFGYTDLTLKAGKVWSKVQFPSLLWPNANLSYTIQPESYTLMNPMEFANDWYASLDLTYWMNGVILNNLPLIKKARLREIFTFRLLSGGLSRKNNPNEDPSLYRFPYNSDTHVLGRTPYMEIGAGIDNIFRILRVDYVWRLTYRHLPGIDRSGLRISLHFSF